LIVPSFLKQMSIEFIPTQTNLAIVARVFSDNPRVDLSYDCYLETTAGRVMVDDAQNPTAFRLEQGPFWYYAGTTTGAAAKQLIKEMPPYTFLMPSPYEWIELAKSIFGRNLTQNQRFSFSGDQLSKSHLESVLEHSRFTGELQRIDTAMAQKFIEEKVYLFDIPGFKSATDFYERGLGYCLFVRGRVVAGAYSAQACSKGIEVSIYVEDRHRQRGIATALAARLVLDCMQRGWVAHWDAANPESCKLAQKLGYRLTGEYAGYFLV
jgi:GNAT superfamily N-acetyltransferase